MTSLSIIIKSKLNKKKREQHIKHLEAELGIFGSEIRDYKQKVVYEESYETKIENVRSKLREQYEDKTLYPDHVARCLNCDHSVFFTSEQFRDMWSRSEAIGSDIYKIISLNEQCCSTPNYYFGTVLNHETWGNINSTMLKQPLLKCVKNHYEKTDALN